MVLGWFWEALKIHKITSKTRETQTRTYYSLFSTPSSTIFSTKQPYSGKSISKAYIKLQNKNVLDLSFLWVIYMLCVSFHPLPVSELIFSYFSY